MSVSTGKDEPKAVRDALSLLDQAIAYTGSSSAGGSR